MEPEIVKIIKDKDDFAFVAEIKDNAKGDPQISVKSRSDESAKDAGQKALEEYKRLHNELKIMDDWIKKDDAVQCILENHFDEIREAVFEQEAESGKE